MNDESDPVRLKDSASSFLAAGLCLLPAVRIGDKKQTTLDKWGPYQTRLPTPDEIERWFGEETESICLVCGEISGHLEAIDFDLGGEAYEPWCELVQEVDPELVAKLVVESTPSGGRHVFYRSEEPVGRNDTLAVKLIETQGPDEIEVGTKSYVPRLHDGVWYAHVTLIETRANGGIILCDPSPGYTLLQGKLTEIPVITADDRDVLLSCARMLDMRPVAVMDCPKRKPGQPVGARPGDDFNQRGEIRDVLTRHGWRRTRAGENEHWCRPGKDRGTSATLKDGVFYVFTSNAPPFEPTNGYSRFAVLTQLEHNGNWSNAASALAKEGYGMKAIEASNDALPEGPPLDAEEFALADPPWKTAGELLADHPALRMPVIEGLLRQGETMNIIAPSKTGKSWLVTGLALSVATGQKWLGRYETHRSDVLIIDNELHGETSANRLPLVAGVMDIELEAYGSSLSIWNLRGALADLHSLVKRLETIAPGTFGVIILDAWYRFLPPGTDENDNGAMAQLYNTLDQTAAAIGCSFVLIHHTSKGSQSAKSVTDIGAGAGAQSRATDTHLVLRDHQEEGCVVLDAAVRSWKPIEPVVLRWSFPLWQIDAALDPDALRKGRAPGVNRKESGKTMEVWTPERFCKAFLSDKPKTKAEIVIEVANVEGLSKTSAGELLSVCEEQKLAVRQQNGASDKVRYVAQQSSSNPGRRED